MFLENIKNNIKIEEISIILNNNFLVKFSEKSHLEQSLYATHKYILIEGNIEISLKVGYSKNNKKKIFSR